MTMCGGAASASRVRRGGQAQARSGSAFSSGNELGLLDRRQVRGDPSFVACAASSWSDSAAVERRRVAGPLVTSRRRPRRRQQVDVAVRKANSCGRGSTVELLGLGGLAQLAQGHAGLGVVAVRRGIRGSWLEALLHAAIALRK